MSTQEIPKNSPELRQKIKELIVSSLRLEGVEPASIADDSPLFGAGLGLDSIDALELVVALEQGFGIKIADGEVGKEAFASVNTLAEFVAGKKPAA